MSFLGRILRKNERLTEVVVNTDVSGQLGYHLDLEFLRGKGARELIGTFPATASPEDIANALMSAAVGIVENPPDTLPRKDLQKLLRILVQGAKLVLDI